MTNITKMLCAIAFSALFALPMAIMAQDCPLTGCTMTGPLNAPEINGVTSVDKSIGSDIGAKINSYIAAHGPVGTLFIPDGNYTFSTPVVIAQTGIQTMTILCGSRAAILNYTGSGSAFTISATTPTVQLLIENCSLNGSNASSGSKGLYLHDSQNVRLNNVLVENFSGVNVYGLGSIHSMLMGTDLLAGGINLEWADDVANEVGSIKNSFIGGSMQYAPIVNFWDNGDSTSWGADTENTVTEAVFEEYPSAPNFIIEGTWNDAITNSYIECLYRSNSANYYNGIIGNKVGSGYGSQTNQSATEFYFAGNHESTCQPGSGDVSASMYVINSIGLHASSIGDTGYVTYGFIFDPAGTNTKTEIEQSRIGWGAALYLNPPTDGMLYQDPGQTETNSEYNSQPGTGYAFGLLTANALTSSSLTSPSGTFITLRPGAGASNTLDIQNSAGTVNELLLDNAGNGSFNGSVSASGVIDRGLTSAGVVYYPVGGPLQTISNAFTGTKRAGNCIFVITSGIITDVRGC